MSHQKNLTQTHISMTTYHWYLPILKKETYLSNLLAYKWTDTEQYSYCTDFFITNEELGLNFIKRKKGKDQVGIYLQFRNKTA